jgi:hypothetical protein
MVVVGKDSLNKRGGSDFANAVLETFYSMNARMADPKTSDATLVGIGARFAKLELEDMKTIVKQTRFYSDANDAVRLFQDPKFQKETMPTVSKFCTKYGLISAPVAITYGTGEGAMEFSVKYIQNYLDSQKK